MGVFKSQFTRALTVIPSSDANIPYPNAIVSGVTTGASTNALIDTGVDFIALNVKEGDIVYNTTSKGAATVLGVTNATTLELNANMTSGGDNYVVYQASAQTGLGNTGCYLVAEDIIDVEVVTVGGDLITIRLSPNINIGLQVIKLISVSTSAQITALW